MRFAINKKLVAGATSLAVLGGGTAVALAATHTRHTTQTSTAPSSTTYLDDLAAKLSITPATLSTALKATDVDQIDAAVTAGDLTQAQADSLITRIDQGDGVLFDGFGHGGAGGGGAGGGGAGGGAGHRGQGPGGSIGGPGDIQTAAATYLGITTAQLQTDLQAGKSLAQIADAASGKSAAGLESALVAAETAKLAAQVSSGALTSAQEQQILSGLTARIDALVQSTGLSPASAPSGAAPPAAGSGL
jgi:hypothetical protein